MPRWFAMTRFLPVLTILGLIVGSFVTPAQARIVESTTMAMADDLPCCPGETGGNCAKDCSLAIMCFVTSLPSATLPTLAAPRIADDEAVFPRDDILLTGVSHSPPRRPPRI
jgi:hypothetical protein